MNFKTDTKEKFTVITVLDTIISANMTEELEKIAVYAEKDIPHVVIKMTNVENIDATSAHKLADLQQSFYEKDCSFVICEMQKNVEEVFEKEELMEVMNITPTENEAWDIVQMEEIERELMMDFENPLDLPKDSPPDPPKDSPLDPPKGED
jgi:anti-anti-sigma factor